MESSWGFSPKAAACESTTDKERVVQFQVQYQFLFARTTLKRSSIHWRAAGGGAGLRAMNVRARVHLRRMMPYVGAALLVGVNGQARRDNSLQSHVINCDSINSRCLHNGFNYCRAWQNQMLPFDSADTLMSCTTSTRQAQSSCVKINQFYLYVCKDRRNEVILEQVS